jgi:hypothetical protein
MRGGKRGDQKMRIVLYSVGLLLIGGAGNAVAQGWYGYGNPWGYGSGYHHASTYEEGVQRGAADIIRSKGAYNLMTSEAMKNVEDARRKYIDNRVHSTEKYFEMRDINKRAREAERGPRPGMEDLIRYSSTRKPNRLSPSELDPLTGDITWPGILRDSQYEEDRKKLENLYGVRAFTGFLNGDQLTQVDSSIKSMEAELSKNVKTYAPQSWTQAKSFLKSLTYESRLRPG